MRHVTEATAKIINDALQAQIAVLLPQQSSSLRVANKIRLMRLAISELNKNKIIRNGKYNNTKK